jgi:hypothetical protein
LEHPDASWNGERRAKGTEIAAKETFDEEASDQQCYGI